ncbi:MAG: AAA domain-containing protein [Proteobacteria bacterium]|nr:AAA domain-containing protein [Pseudomonadota bacterium]
MDTNYANALDNDGRDLVDAARDNDLPPVDFRDALVAQVVDLLDKKKSVLLVGPDGVGKTSVIHGVAARMASRGVGDLIELSCTAIMSGTKYLGEWQSKVTAIAKQASEFDTVLYISDVWNLPKTGRTAQNDNNLLDALKPSLTGAGTLTLLAEASPETLRLMERVPGFVQLFTKVVIGPLPEVDVERTLDRAAGRGGFTLDDDARHTLVQLTSRFLPARPQPGPALELLSQARDYQLEKQAAGEDCELDGALIERVFSVYSGLPMFVVSRQATMTAGEIRAWFEDRIVGQREGIEAVVEAIALFKAGLHDPDKPIGTFLFVGPTGVGKTEVARALARFLYGSESRLLRFDLSEYKDFHSFEMLVGNPKDPGRPAALVDPVRAQPFQVVLLDELEKAHSNIWDMLLGVLDEGRLTPPGGKTVDFRSTILIATSNVGAQASDKRFGFSPDTGVSARRHSVTKALEGHFRPEFLNRFQHVTVFHALTKEQVKQVARWDLRRVLKRDGIAGRNLVVEVTDEALDVVIDSGFDPRYGARALKREIQRQLVLPLAMTLMEKNVEAGSILKLHAADGRIRVRLLETDEIREARAEQAPVKADGEKLTKKAVQSRLGAATDRIEELAQAAHETDLVAQRDRLDEARNAPDFWATPDVAARLLRDLDHVTGTLDRIDGLRSWNERLTEQAAGSNRSTLQRVVRDLHRHERALTGAWRELVVMGFDGHWDALIEVRPISAKPDARNLVVQQLVAWAQHRKMEVVWVREPMRAVGPALLAIKGRYAAGLLAGEAGLHRLKDRKNSHVARVRVAPWTDVEGEIQFGDHRALKGKTGQFGGRVRSRVECKTGLVVQNAHNLSENRELARDVGPAWSAAPAPSDAAVRRYENQKVIKDSTGWTPGNRGLSPQLWHEILCHRVDQG